MPDQWSGFTVLRRTPTGGRERQEGQASWQELPTDILGRYPRALWLPTLQQEFLHPEISQRQTELKEGVFLHFFAQGEKDRLGPGETGLAIVSHGLAEVFCGETKMLGYETPIVTASGAVLLPAQAYYPGGRAEIFFNEPGQAVELQIKIGEQTVGEVKIVNC